jgi:hypothetical protein
MAAAACCVGAATAQPSAPQAASGSAIGREWRGDEDFYAVVVAYDRAELAWRHFRNRLCAMPEPRRTSLSHVVRETRERLDTMRSRMDVLWPNAPIDRFRYMARTDPEPKMLCDDRAAAEEAFQAALAGHDGTQNLIRLIERARQPKDTR